MLSLIKVLFSQCFAHSIGSQARSAAFLIVRDALEISPTELRGTQPAVTFAVAKPITGAEHTNESAMILELGLNFYCYAKMTANVL